MEMKKKTTLLKSQAPAERFQQLQSELKKQIIDDFVIRTLLAQEVRRLNIPASEQEINEAMERVKSTLPPGANFDDLLKKNEMTGEKFREEINFGVKINKLVLSQPIAKTHR